jgi:hypothetical protein
MGHRATRIWRTFFLGDEAESRISNGFEAVKGRGHEMVWKVILRPLHLVDNTGITGEKRGDGLGITTRPAGTSFG